MQLKKAKNITTVQPIEPPLNGKKVSLMDALKDSFAKSPEKLLRVG